MPTTRAIGVHAAAGACRRDQLSSALLAYPDARVGRLDDRTPFPGGLAGKTTGFGPVDRGSNPRPGAGCQVRNLATSSGVVRGAHGRGGPAFDLPVQAGAAPDFHAHAAVIAGAHVLANCRRAVPLEGRAPELRGVRSG